MLDQRPKFYGRNRRFKTYGLVFIQNEAEISFLPFLATNHMNGWIADVQTVFKLDWSGSCHILVSYILFVIILHLMSIDKYDILQNGMTLLPSGLPIRSTSGAYNSFALSPASQSSIGSVHLGTPAIYGSLKKWPWNCRPRRFEPHFFSWTQTARP